MDLIEQYIKMVGKTVDIQDYFNKKKFHIEDNTLYHNGKIFYGIEYKPGEQDQLQEMLLVKDYFKYSIIELLYDFVYEWYPDYRYTPAETRPFEIFRFMEQL